jgi:glucose-1-phosphatase
MNQVKTILLDVGQVLVALDFPAALRRVMQHSRLSAEEIRKRLLDHPAIISYESGQISTEEFHCTIGRLLEMEVTLEEFKAGWAQIFALDAGDGQCISPAFFRELKERYQLVAVSNTNQMHWEYLESVMPLLAEFDDLVLSYQVGAMKPQPLIYEAVLQRTGRAPEELFLVDDLALNIEGAQQFGIRGVVYRDEARLRKDLSKLGLIEG